MGGLDAIERETPWREKSLVIHRIEAESRLDEVEKEKKFKLETRSGASRKKKTHARITVGQT